MSGASEQVGGDLAIEDRDARLAELDAHIEVEAAVRQERPTAKPKQRGRRSSPRLPAVVARKLPALPES